ncbi:MAG: hypothetical protein IPP20_15230 [Gemmatimonadetes bacterium]|nr:hypothetical protein [Gemmatimonadota bacterium]
MGPRSPSAGATSSGTGDEAFDTLLHEMVHQWQEENGHPIDHGPLFRQKAHEVGTTPRAKRTLR